MRLEQKIRLLQNLPLIGQIEPSALRVLAFSAEEKSFRASDELFRKGDESAGGLLILTGRVALNARGTGGIAHAENFGPGVLLGESALFAPTTRPATAVAVEPTTALDLSRALVHKVLEAHPDSAAILRRHVASTVAATEFSLRGLLD